MAQDRRQDLSSLQDEITRSLDAPPELVPFLPELLADLHELGSDPAAVLDALRKGGLARGARVLDLGCGKGALSFAVADAFDASVHGVDGLDAFIDDARSEAVARGLETRCSFEPADLRETISRAESRPFDAVLLIAVGRALGNAAQTMRALRRAVVPGGLMVIDDGFAADGCTLEGYESHADTLRAMAAMGDTLVHEHIQPREVQEGLDALNTRAIRRRAQQLSQRHPEYAGLFEAYVRSQEERAALMARELVPAVWCVRRGA